MGQSFELSNYARAVRRHWLVALVTVLVCAGLAFAYATLAPRTVTATAAVNVSAITSDAFGGQRSAAMLLDPVTEEQTARSSQVLADTAAALGSATSMRDVRRSMGAEMIPDATVMRLTYTAGSTRVAVAGADALAKAYLDARSSAAETKVRRIIAQLQDTRDKLRAELVDLNRVTATAPSTSRRASEAAAQRQIINSQLDSLLTQINQLSAIDTSGGSVITGASDNPLKIQPRTRLWVGGGAALGLVLGLLAALAMGAASRRADDPAAVSRAGGGQMLARLRARHGSVPANGVDADELSGARERLLAGLPPVATLVAVDLTDGGHASDVAANLALSFAEAGQQVRLILPSWDGRTVERLRQVVEPSSVRVDTVGREDATQRDRSPATVAAGSARGSSVPFPVEPSGSMTVVGLASDAGRAALLSWVRRSDGAVLVVTEGRTATERIASIVQDVTAVGVPVLGSVLVPAGRELRLDGATGQQRS